MTPPIHTTILSIALLSATLSYAQETNKFVSMPDGTKVVVIQEYASSYMVTKEGEHKPFFLEKTHSASVSPTPAQIATNTAGLPKTLIIDDSNAMGALLRKGMEVPITGETRSTIRVETPDHQMVELPKSQIAPEDQAIIVWRGIYGPTETIQEPNPWENKNNALSVLTPQEAERFISVVKGVKLDWDKLGNAGKKFNDMAYDDMEAGMLKDDPSIKPLLEKVKAFHPFPPHTFRLPTEIQTATGFKRKGMIVTIEKENPDSLSVVDQSSQAARGVATHEKFTIDKSVTNGVVWLVP